MSSQKQIDPKKQQELQNQYTNFKNTLQQLAQKIGDIEQEAEEHNGIFRIESRATPLASTTSNVSTNIYNANINVSFRLVIETLDPLAADRKCFRMVNGVLVERTVQDVLPTLKTNSDGLKQVLEDMLKQYKSKQGELDNWKKKNNIQVVQP
ncbi:Prefoldin [Penicillium italicum]|uniref:Prefoldin n=1 Tax=Penicillium italicum TaxID=40296 RepID=A0A0A2L6H3_PENIT|nr:Prefoldin [Penicillium italicum]